MLIFFFFSFFFAMFHIKTKFVSRILWMVVGMALKFCTSVTKRIKVNFRKFFGLIFTSAVVTGEKLVLGSFCPTPPPPPPSPPPPFWIGLKIIISTILCKVLLFRSYCNEIFLNYSVVFIMVIMRNNYLGKMINNLWFKNGGEP